MSKNLLLIGGVFALIAIALGAFGAHSLQKHLSEHMLDVFKTGANYQLTQSLGIILVGILLQLNPEIRHFRFAGFLLTGGIVIFSGSLYAYSLTGIQTWALITPLGGLCFMLGWAVFLVGATKIRAE